MPPARRYNAPVKSSYRAVKLALTYAYAGAREIREHTNSSRILRGVLMKDVCGSLVHCTERARGTQDARGSVPAQRDLLERLG